MEAALIGPLGRTVLRATKITIGRAPDNTLVVSDVKASSHHAEIRPEGQYYSIVDLGSTNGTFVNEQRIYSRALRQLQPGDTVRIGDTKFTFEMSSTPQSASYPEGSMVRAMQNTPSPPWQPFTPPSSGPQQPLTPSPSAPSESSTRKRTKALKSLAGVGSLLGTIAAILAIAQFMGLTRIQDLFTHPTPTPIPLPVIAETTYDVMSPYCDRTKDPSDIVWGIGGATPKCSSSGGTTFTQTDLRYVPELAFEAANGHELASNETISANFSGIAFNVCAGLGTRQMGAAGYAFFICGDGHWYILEYFESGRPLVLLQSSSETQERPSDHYSLFVTVVNNTLQMVIGGGQTHTVQNSVNTITTSDSILISEEAVIRNDTPADFLASVTVSNFHYAQV